MGVFAHISTMARTGKSGEEGDIFERILYKGQGRSNTQPCNTKKAV